MRTFYFIIFSNKAYLPGKLALRVNSLKLYKSQGCYLDDFLYEQIRLFQTSTSFKQDVDFFPDLCPKVKIS